MNKEVMIQPSRREKTPSSAKTNANSAEAIIKGISNLSISIVILRGEKIPANPRIRAMLIILLPTRFPIAIGLLFLMAATTLTLVSGIDVP